MSPSLFFGIRIIQNRQSKVTSFFVFLSAPQDGGLQKGSLPLLRGGQSRRVCRVPAPRERPLRRAPLHHGEVCVRQVGQVSRHQVLQPVLAAVVTLAEPTWKCYTIIIVIIIIVIVITIWETAESQHRQKACSLKWPSILAQVSLHISKKSVVWGGLLGTSWMTHIQSSDICH